jgi:hypothetical protein
MPHLRGRRFGKRDGDDLGRISNFDQQAQKAPRQQIGFAGSGWSLDQD